MRSLFSKLWADDKGVVLSAELALLLAIVVIGIIPGLVALRNAANSKLGTLANGILAVNDSYQYATYSIEQSSEVSNGEPEGRLGRGERGEDNLIATVGGTQFVPNIEQLNSSRVGDVDSGVQAHFNEEVEVAP